MGNVEVNKYKVSCTEYVSKRLLTEISIILEF